MVHRASTSFFLFDGIRDGIARGSRGSTSASHGVGIDDRAFVRRWNDLPHCDESHEFGECELYDALYSFAALADHHLDDYPSSWMPTRSIYSYAKVCVALSALAYCFLVCAGDALVGATAAVLLGAFTVNVSMMFYVLSQCLGDPRVRSLRFWGAALLVFLAFFLGIALASMAIHASGDRDIDRFVVLSLCSYLFFIVCFRESWSFQKPQALAVKRIAVTPLLANSLENELHERCRAIADVYQLTDRETEVLTCLSEGWSIPAAARRLMVSQDTVRTHVKHIYAKIGIHSRDDLVEIIKMPDGSLLPKSG